MKSFQRTDRLGQLILREIATIIQLKMRDPRVSFVNVNTVNVTRDLSLARIHVSTLGDERNNLDMVKVLNKAAGFLRTELAKKIEARLIPELRFIFDDTQLRGNRIDDILSIPEIADLDSIPQTDDED
jgi:ribosome-binding factor A